MWIANTLSKGQSAEVKETMNKDCHISYVNQRDLLRKR